MTKARMESIRGFLVYFSRKYKDRNLYLKGVHLTLDSLIPYRDEEGWRLRREELKIAKVEGNWEGIEEVEKLILVIRVTQLKLDLLALGRLT